MQDSPASRPKVKPRSGGAPAPTCDVKVELSTAADMMVVVVGVKMRERNSQLHRLGRARRTPVDSDRYSGGGAAEV